MAFAPETYTAVRASDGATAVHLLLLLLALAIMSMCALLMFLSCLVNEEWVRPTGCREVSSVSAPHWPSVPSTGSRGPQSNHRNLACALLLEVRTLASAPGCPSKTVAASTPQCSTPYIAGTTGPPSRCTSALLFLLILVLLLRFQLVLMLQASFLWGRVPPRWRCLLAACLNCRLYC